MQSGGGLAGQPGIPGQQSSLPPNLQQPVSITQQQVSYQNPITIISALHHLTLVGSKGLCICIPNEFHQNS